MTPVVGFVADVANAGISVARGNYADASINLAAAVPGAGQAVMGAKLAAVGFGVYKSAKFAKNVGSSFSGAGNKIVHKNSLDYVGDTHVYRVRGPDGSTYKIGESAQGVRVGDGASIRAEQQARRLTRQTGDTYTTEIRKTFPDKASARDYETRLIERFRRLYGEGALPGNKTNR